MIIQKEKIGAYNSKTVYFLCNEVGGRYETLARFDTLETATNVLRYIRGDILTREQIADAIRAMRRIDEKEGA